MAKIGVKHLIKCVCVLPQLSKLRNPPSHEFSVFSTLDDDSNDFDTTFVQCNNCGIVHKIIDICSSVIMRGKEELRSVITLEDVKNSVPEKLSAVLEQHHVELSTWQQVAWIIEAHQWGSSVILSSEYIDGIRQGKTMTILGESLFKINTFTYDIAAEK